MRRYIKHSRQCFIGYPNTSNFVKNTPLRVVFSTLFSVFGYPDKTLSLVFDILHHRLTELAPLFHPIKSKTKTNRDSLARVFTCFAPATCIFSKFSWLAHWNVYVLCDWLTGMSVAFVIGSLECLYCGLCDLLTGMSVSFVICSLECLCPWWLAHWNVCGLCDWFTGMSVLWPLWLAHWNVCVLCDWRTGMSMFFVIGQSEHFGFGMTKKVTEGPFWCKFCFLLVVHVQMILENNANK